MHLESPRIGRFPLIEKCLIREIKPPVMLDVLKQIKKRDAAKIAHSNAQMQSNISLCYRLRNCIKQSSASVLRGALKSRIKSMHSAILVADLSEILQTLAKNEIRIFLVMRILMRLMTLTFVRTSGLAEALL
jgi:hypothetical protein